jgi:prepilin-type processing-associated H-X9-DG protein
MEQTRADADSATGDERSRALDYAGAGRRARAGPLAIASMICALLVMPSLYAVSTAGGGRAVVAAAALALPLIAIGLACAAVREERRRGIPSSSPAIAGLVLGGFELLVLLVVVTSMPLLGRSRETANVVRCGSNLRQIGQALRLYANAHAGRYPPDLETLLMTGDISPDELICAASDDEAAAGPTTRAVIDKLRSEARHCSYVYVGAGFTVGAVNETHVLAYEPTGNHKGNGMNVLFGDGHVDFLSRSEAGYVLNELRQGHNPPGARAAAPGPASRGG